MANTPRNTRTVDIDDLFGIRWGITTGTPTSIDYALSVVNRLISGTPSVVPKEEEIQVPVVVAPTPTGPRRKVALIVGHNASNKGAFARSPIGKFEFDYNNEVADELVKNPPAGIEFRRFNRVYSTSGYTSEINTVYAQVNTWNPVFSIELHFNGGGNGDYITMLHANTSVTSRDLAQTFQNVFVEELGFRNFGLMPRTRSQRGGESLFAARGPIVLTEPFFGDNQTHVNKVHSLGIKGMAAIYAKATTEHMKKFS